MPTVSEFRTSLKGAIAYDIVDNVILSNSPKHVSSDLMAYLIEEISAAYQLTSSDVQIIVTGSANLGFSIVEKRRNGQVIKERYRLFSAESDIDVAVISQPIFGRVWDELCGYSHRQSYFPWRSERLGDYLVCGWLRPDHFPKHVRLRECDQWSDTFNAITRSRKFGRRRVNGGMFYSLRFLRMYMSRAVNDCIMLENEQ